jgi:hypothetical protein
MNTEIEAVFSLQPFVPDPGTFYPLDTAAHLARMPRHVVLVCCRRGLVTPHIDPNFGALSFDLDGIRTLQRIEYLRTGRGANLAGIEIILRLMAELQELRAASQS